MGTRSMGWDRQMCRFRSCRGCQDEQKLRVIKPVILTKGCKHDCTQGFRTIGQAPVVDALQDVGEHGIFVLILCSLSTGNRVRIRDAMAINDLTGVADAK